MRIFLLTLDSSCFGREEEDYPEVGKLKSWQNNGWVDLIKSGVLEKESEELSGQYLQTLKEKTKHLSVDHGIVVYGFPGAEHIPSELVWWYGSVRSKFEEIYEILFGERWQEGKEAAGKIRDALHLDTHLINDRDYFVTKDKHHLLIRASELERHFGIKVRSPQDCVKEIEDYWKEKCEVDPFIRTG